MTRLVVLVEGQTEEGFVNNVLSTHLYSVGYTMVRTHLLGNARQQVREGGIVPWTVAEQDIVDDLLQDQGAIVTTMVDYYRLPGSWPGRTDAATKQAVVERSATVEDAVLGQIVASLNNFNPGRFIPYIVMHEFEALLFSDPRQFANGIGDPGLSPSFHSIRSAFATPEHIDDSPETHPSKRITDLVRGYNKPRMGLLAVQAIGLDSIRSECSLFDRWLTRLEQAVQI